MENKWKKLSNINPQRESGRREIANDVFDALIEADLTSGEYKFIMFIINKTWGFNKKSDVLSSSQIATATNLSLRSIKYIQKILKRLRIVDYAPSKRVQRGSPLNEYLFNKHHDTWIKRGQQVARVQSNVKKGAKHRQKRVQRGSPTKETITKETITKEKYSQNSDEFRLSQLLFNLIRERDPNHKKPDFEKWALHINRMIRLDNRNTSDIEATIKWCQDDEFWQNNTLCTQKLREKFGQLYLKMKKTKTQDKEESLEERMRKREEKHRALGLST